MISDERITIPLPHGGQLRCEAGIDCMWGGSVHIDDPEGNEIIMWSSEEWGEDPETVMGAIFKMAVSQPRNLIKSLGKTKVVDQVWV